MKAIFRLLMLVAISSVRAFGDEVFLVAWETFEYPLLGVQAQIAGEVELEVTIGSLGTVTRTKVISGHRVLAEAAETAIRKWRFTQRGLEASSTKETSVRFHFSFKLQGAVEHRPRTRIAYVHPWVVTVLGEAVHFQP
ncbi:TonB family protein [Paludibaculum fermentans]|uniref:TonB family protein n=1 Tax=Paludibaculum fermentans TaxID=1473598 RepID=UPI003EBF97BD